MEGWIKHLRTELSLCLNRLVNSISLNWGKLILMIFHCVLQSDETRGERHRGYEYFRLKSEVRRPARALKPQSLASFLVTCINYDLQVALIEQCCQTDSKLKIHMHHQIEKLRAGNCKNELVTGLTRLPQGQWQLKLARKNFGLSLTVLPPCGPELNQTGILG